MTTTFAPDDTLTLTNLKKVFWPEAGLTKGDLLDYYRAIAPFMLPYLADRPMVLHRHVDGHAGKEFFQRVSRKCPPWVKIARIELEGRRNREFHLCQDWPTLLWLANFGCIEFIPWASRVGSLDSPDYMVIDLDPADGVPFGQVIEVALATRRILDQLAVTSCPKTSGKRGLHIYVPLARRYSFPQAKMLSELVARLVHRALPQTTTLDPRTEQRTGRVYLDTTRNSRGQAVAVAYSARPHSGATVSAPLKWSEVRSTLDPARFTIQTMQKRLAKLGDLWAPVLGPGIELRDCLRRLERCL